MERRAIALDYNPSGEVKLHFMHLPGHPQALLRFFGRFSWVRLLGVLLTVLVRLLKARLKVLLKVLIRLLKARLKVLLKVLMGLYRALQKGSTL